MNQGHSDRRPAGTVSSGGKRSPAAGWVWMSARQEEGLTCLGYRDTAQYAVNEHRDTALTLGTAAAVSGAAASPNMGYHSSPAVTFLLALFNVRLGWWLGNPGKPGGRPEDRTHSYDKPGPRFAPGPFFAEAFGLTDDCSPYAPISLEAPPA